MVTASDEVEREMFLRGGEEAGDGSGVDGSEVGLELGALAPATSRFNFRNLHLVSRHVQTQHKVSLVGFLCNVPLLPFKHGYLSSAQSFKHVF